MLGLKVPICPEHEQAVEYREAHGEKVIPAPNEVEGGDEGVGEQRTADAANTVGAVHEAQRRGRVGQAAAEDITQGEVDGHAQADEEEADDDGGEGRTAHNQEVARDHEELGERERAAPPHALAEGVDEAGAHDEADGLADKD